MIKDPTTFDPRKAHDLASTTVSYLLYEGLFRSGENKHLENALCESVSISSDGKTYLFKLKPAFWSDGTPITAFDFESSWFSQLQPSTPSPYGYLFFPIKNAESFKNNQCHKSQVGISAIHHNLLKVELNHPKQDFLELLSFSAFFPCKDTQKGPVFSGPYALQAYEPHKELVLKKNSFFHDQILIQPDFLRIKILDSEMTALHLFKSQTLDLIGGPLAPIPLDEMNVNSPKYFQAMNGQTLCIFNTQKGIFKNLNMRKAFAYAIDLKQIHKSYPEGFKEPSSFLPFETKNSSSITFQTSQARLFLEKGMKELQLEKEDLTNLIYYFGAKPEHLRLAQILKECWKQNLNLDVNLVKLEHKLLSKKLADKDFELIQAIWLAPYDSPSSVLDRFCDGNLAKNFSGYSSSNILKTCLEFDIGHLSKTQCLETINQEFQELIPFVPLVNWTYPYYISKKIKHLCFTNLGTINFTYLKIHEDSCGKDPKSGI